MYMDLSMFLAYIKYVSKMNYVFLYKMNYVVIFLIFHCPFLENTGNDNWEAPFDQNAMKTQMAV